jgi:ribosomal protein L37AE/L43A
MAKSDPNNFSAKTKDVLAKRAGQICTMCRRHTSGGNANPKKATMIGDAAHIEGAKSSERRYNSSMTPEERSDIENGIWLCKSCHKEIDDNALRFTVEFLHKIKIDHEESILNLSSNGQGGKGGNASVSGNGTAMGGRGGGGGVDGKGGDGGDANVVGDGFAMGGEGGEAGQLNRPARGGRSPFEILGIPNEQLPDGSWLWEKGRGGDGAFPAPKCN